MMRNFKYIFSIIAVLQLLQVFHSVNTEQKKSSTKTPLPKVKLNPNIDSDEYKYLSYIEINNILYKWHSAKNGFLIYLGVLL